MLSVFGIFLYFLGWIYRWAYFGFFQLQITSLTFPIESFFIVPIQAILGDFWIFIRASLVLLITIALIQFTIWLISCVRAKFVRKLHKKTRNFFLLKFLRSFVKFLSLPLSHEIIAVAWILAALFWLGRWQGEADAYRDAVNITSTRPIATLVSPNDKMALGRNLDDLLINPPLKGFRIIGDVEQFRQIFGREVNDTTNLKEPLLWRLLIENDSWVYLFPGMPREAKLNQRPPVLAVNKSDGQIQLLILSHPKILP
ncbi:hypothetical protein [Fortiea sp. LEGE XX443]|nr:hypothetical protein [Fortiea sp. LEGE XX443]